LNGSPDITRVVQHEERTLRALLDQVVQDGQAKDRDALVRRIEAFHRAVRGVLLDFVARAWVQGKELRSRFDALSAPKLEPLKGAAPEDVAPAAKRYLLSFEKSARLVADELVPLIVGMLEDSELAEITRDFSSELARG
jgi:hypothetical protein